MLWLTNIYPTVNTANGQHYGLAATNLHFNCAPSIVQHIPKSRFRSEVFSLQSLCDWSEIIVDGDDGTNDLLVSDVIRTNELQVWFLAEHLVAEPLGRASGR
jgi:hypothetical protein